MSLKKKITGNISELADYAKEKELAVKILFKGVWEPDQTGFQLISGKTVYSAGTKKFVEKLPLGRRLKTPSMNPKDLEEACDEAIERLKKEAQSNLQYLHSRKIECYISELNVGRESKKEGAD